jgi:ABC-2 type transporter
VDFLSMGLLISAVVNTEEQTIALIPVAMIVQLLLGGAIVTVKDMGAVMGGLAALAFSRWSFEGAGNLIGMNGRIAANAYFRESSPYAHSFFSLPALGAFAVLLAFLALFLGLTLVALHRRVS